MVIFLNGKSKTHVVLIICIKECTIPEEYNLTEGNPIYESDPDDW
jgi:hypothetical protein